MIKDIGLCEYLNYTFTRYVLNYFLNKVIILHKKINNMQLLMND